MRIAIFASGNGTNAEALAKAFPDQVKLIFSDHRDAYVLERAERLGIMTEAFELREFDGKRAYEEAIVALLEAQKIDLVCLAGYMKIISQTLLSAYEGRIINIHPSYLPAFGGTPHAIEESWQAKSGLGVTVHLVDAGVDTGMIIAQRKVPYMEKLEDYEVRLHQVEHELYPEVIKNWIEKEQS
ncbi:phosphoribosylglycinamide formyltransferase [Lactococcus termiticola]|uniref:Phosphoribosylglycinamide formyltransferase n=1 Tax=Lactococcus termiticola TaxID=2169526 RepID=A0A2R5HDS0_9LACT|nr:phosphoribosylglycinamide formyltransferase [Lactococcus termiticola]GBG96199.1 phosphoribosylglycinamide formyltransferase [Lactococcus termiticola]